MTDSPAPLVFQVLIKGSIDAVWNEITKTDEIQMAFFKSRMHVEAFEPGQKMHMRTPNGKYTSVVGEIVEFTPKTRFVTTFRFTNFEDPPCRVVHALREVDGGTEYTMSVEDLAPGTKTAKHMTQGGNMICKAIKSIVETGKAPLGFRMMMSMFAFIGAIHTPKVCRTENWK